MTEPVWPILSNPIRRRGITRQAPDLGSEPPEWTLAALCTQFDPEDWYPPKGCPPTTARLICGRCPVTAECLEDALAEPAERDHGVRAGLTARERRKLRQQRRAA